MGKRGNHEGTIRERKDGSIEARVTVGYTAEGKQRQISKYFKTKKDAGALLAEVQTQQNNGTFIDPHKILFCQWLNQWLETYIKPPIRRINTYSNYETMVRAYRSGPWIYSVNQITDHRPSEVI